MIQMLNLGVLPHLIMLFNPFVVSLSHFFLQTKDKYMVTVQIKDMMGGAKGLSNTGTATITLADINDNPPTFTKPSVSH